MKSTSMLFAVASTLLLFLNVNPSQAVAQDSGDDPQAETCQPSPAAGTKINSAQVGDYVGVAVLMESNADGCDGCNFKIKFLIGIIGTDTNGNPDTTRVPNPSDEYDDWHPTTGPHANNNITRTEDRRGTSGNSSVKQITPKMGCGAKAKTIKMSVETNSPIPASPNSDPTAAPSIVKLEWTINLQCKACPDDNDTIIEDSTILDTTIYEHKRTMGDRFNASSEDVQFTVISGNAAQPELRIAAGPELTGKTYDLRIVGLSGKLIHSQSGTISGSNASIPLQMNNLANGIYIATLQLPGRATYNTRFVITGQ